jgi:hypothetical protein
VKALSCGQVRARAAKIVMWTAVFGPLLALLFAAVGAFIGVAIAETEDLSESTKDVLGFTGGGLGILAGLTMATHEIAVLARSGVWLDGSRLTVRRARARTVDLATAAHIILDVRNETRPPMAPMYTPTLVIIHVKFRGALRLRTARDELVPPDELRALADAMPASHEDVASRLRAIAEDPRSVYR